MTLPYSGPGYSMGGKKRPSVNCRICGLPIERPGPLQKVHAGKCHREWSIRNSAKTHAKTRASKTRKSERARIGKIAGRKPARSPKYLAWIRTLACLLCRTRVGVEAAHSGPHGISQKAPDTSALPLCAQCHRIDKFSYHALGVKFFKTHRLAPREELVMAYSLAYKESREAAA